jgi:hypothetical protein
MGDGGGTFIRIEEPTTLQAGTVICVGASHLIVGLIYDKFESVDPNISNNNFSRIQNPVNVSQSLIMNSFCKNNEEVCT